jgi:pyrroline-5-carboxylate reductase
MKIGFIGMGNMAKALAGGFIASGKLKEEDILAYAPNQEKLMANADRFGFVAVSNIVDLVKGADIVFIACKPYQIDGVLKEVRDSLSGKAIISVAAGWVYSSYATKLGSSVRIQCVMPNTPAMCGEGVFLFEEMNSLSVDEDAFIKALFEAIGIVEVIPTELMGIGGAISGCGPAFMDMIMEAYADAGVKYGLSRSTAYKLISQTMIGSAKLLQASGKHPGLLKDEVCSPGGTTIRGVEALEKGGLRAACMDSVNAIMDFKKK